MAEDEDYEQDSEAYRKWRSGEDNDRYASSKTPSETGARSGSYTTPKSENDEYTPPDEDDNSEKLIFKFSDIDLCRLKPDYNNLLKEYSYGE